MTVEVLSVVKINKCDRGLSTSLEVFVVVLAR